MAGGGGVIHWQSGALTAARSVPTRRPGSRRGRSEPRTVGGAVAFGVSVTRDLVTTGPRRRRGKAYVRGPAEAHGSPWRCPRGGSNSARDRSAASRRPFAVSPVSAAVSPPPSHPGATSRSSAHHLVREARVRGSTRIAEPARRRGGRGRSLGALGDGSGPVVVAHRRPRGAWGVRYLATLFFAFPSRSSASATQSSRHASARRPPAPTRRAALRGPPASGANFESAESRASPARQAAAAIRCVTVEAHAGEHRRRPTVRASLG